MGLEVEWTETENVVSRDCHAQQVLRVLGEQGLK
jgi:hypothetical protein